MKGFIFDIQHYAIYDGPGIRTTIFFKGCPLQCLWCHNPESQLLRPQVSYFSERCKRCGACVKACPNLALSLTNSGVEIKTDLCKLCTTCIRVCPNKARALIGEEKTIEEIKDIICQDKPFYEGSGGGVTISGGEATLQSTFLIELLSSLKVEGIHTALETCGYFKKDLISKLVEVVDLFLYDIKHIDNEAHKKFTGVSNDIILSNFEKILEIIDSKRIIVRIPLIPNVNTNLRVVSQIAEYLIDKNYSGPIHLMPYNKLSKTKYDKVGKLNNYKDMGILTEDTIANISKEFEKYSFTVIINH